VIDGLLQQIAVMVRRVSWMHESAYSLDLRERRRSSSQ
jgi:hypothetical protein